MAEAHDPFDSATSRSLSARPHLRSDLKSVYENQGSGAARIRLVDPVSGKQFAFTEQEHALCQAADGKASLREIHADQEGRSAAPLTPREVLAFFRRLQILGLLRPDPVDATGVEPIQPAPVPTPDSGRAKGRLQNRFSNLRSARPATASSAAGTPVARSPAGSVPADEAAAPPDVPAAADTVAGPVADSPLRARRAARLSSPRPKAKPADPALGESGFTKPGSTEPDPIESGLPDASSTGPALPGTEPAAAPLPLILLTALEPSAPAEPPAPAAPASQAAGGAAMDFIAGNLGSASPSGPAHQPDDDDDDGYFVGAMGGGGIFGKAGGRAGGPGGGLGGGMGGGGMGGGFGGGMGGMGGGGNAERLLAALAARKAGGGAGGGMGGGFGGGAGMGAGMGGGGGFGGMAGGMGGAMGARRAGAAAPAVRDSRPASLTLFNPGRLLRALYILFYPFRLILWIIVPFVLMAGMAALQNWQALAVDFHRLLSDYATLTLLLIGLFTVNLASRLAQGVAIVAQGGKVESLSLSLVFGFMPRFFIDLSAIPALDRRGQLWAHAAPLLARLWLFAGGTLLWAVTRDSGTWLPDIALIVGHFGFGMFLFSALPLVPSDGLRWVSTYLDEPKLLAKTAMALRHVLTRRPLPPMVTREELPRLALFGIGMALTLSAVVLGVAVFAGLALEEDYGGLGVVVFLGLVLSFLLWLGAMKAGIGQRGAARRPPGMDQAALARALMGAAAGETAAEAVLAPETEGSSNAAKVVWGVIAAGLLAVAFLPYDYEAGGTVQILPLARGQAVARSDGEILEIVVQENDLVTRGQMLAQLSSWNQAREVGVTESMLEGAKASLARLEAGAKPEEIEVARRQLASAEASLAFSRAEAQRAKELVASGTISQQAFEKTDTAYQADMASLEVARASLNLVESDATPEELSISRAEVERLTRELTFRRDALDRTRILAPMDGRVVTPDLQLRHGSYLDEGDMLLEIEASDVVNAAISVPESDIGLIAIGAPVRLKAWGQSDLEVPGVVKAVAPAATDAGYGSVVRVDATFQNPDGLLRSAMTGYAKIEGAEMRVWEAYLRRITRFFEIEVWSWIP